MPTIPVSVFEALDRIEHHADAIYVRHLVGDQVQNVPLSELPAPIALQWACHWLREQLKDIDASS